MDPLAHILHRSDTYVGSTRPRDLEDYVSEASHDFRIVKKIINYSPAIIRIFIEPLSNAIDNVARSQKTQTPCTTIKVNVNLENGTTSVWNDGDCIPIEINEEEGCYNHSLIFGQLLTSSNYDDEDDRYNISGRNGLGIKLCNVFSKYFAVQAVDPDNNKMYFQEWTDNMKLVQEPEITTTKLKKGYTEVLWTPDFKQFGMKGYTQDIIDLYCRYVVDAAMLTNINVYFNNVLIPIKNLKDYSRLYSNVDEKDIMFVNTKDAQIIITPSSQFQSVSFVNGVYTSLGGTHVDAWVEAAFRPLVQNLTKPKSVTYNIGDIKKFFRIFVVVQVINPEFESQSKHKLESPVSASFKKAYTTAMMKWSVIDDIRRSKEMVVLKKLERKKKNFVKIDGLDPANNEGGAFGHQCTLILVEGLAAKTYAVKGIDVGAFGKQGRDWFGIYALRGKVLNVRNAKAASIAKNNVVADIIKALGAKLDYNYSEDRLYFTLRYGRILIITDADVDGIHISGLIQNMIHTLFPTLLERTKPFITSMQTPIVRVFQPCSLTGGKKNELLFYDEREYQKYVTKFNVKFPGKEIDKKYYKGLGSSTDQDIADTFGQKMIELQNDENTSFNMNKIFHTKQADARKIWLENYNVNDVALAWEGDKQETITLNMSDFLNTEMIKFSLNDCKRSIPGLMDGQKESQRKTLYACFLRNLRYTGKSLKVAQLAGYCAEHTAYHHGEQNLYDTITRMANVYPGSNNIPLLYRDGQYGTRLSGGKDAANARYIFTKLDGMTRFLFPKEDDVLLDRVVDDGDVVEPTFYSPILPVILINGCTVGIGTGWSCSVPCYNPIDLIASVKTWLDNDGKVLLKDDDGTTVSLLPEITPWYRGYTGLIEKSSDARYTSWGNVTVDKKTKVVDELPIGMWTDNFKEFLDGLREEKDIKNVKNHSTPKNPKFTITEEKDGIICNNKTLKLYKYIYTSNMVLFDENGFIKKYDNVDEIINSFCKVRFEYYIKRKKHLLGQMDHDIKFLGNKRRFLEEVMSGEIKLFDDSGKTRKSKKVAAMIDDLEKRGYDKDTKPTVKKDEDDEDNEDKQTGGYDYLLRLQFRSITEERILKLQKDIASRIKEKKILSKKSEKSLWIHDLDEFEKAYIKWEKVINKEVVKKKK